MKGSVLIVGRSTWGKCEKNQNHPRYNEIVESIRLKEHPLVSQVEAKSFANEPELREFVLSMLEPHFEIVKKELKSRHWSGEEMKLDAVLRPRITTEWRRKDVALGIEFKHLKRNHKRVHEACWINQALDYSDVEWDGFGYLPIFLCPFMISDAELEKGSLLLNVLGDHNVGGLSVHASHGLTFWLHNISRRVWSEAEPGFVGHTGRTSDLERKFGNH